MNRSQSSSGQQPYTAQPTLNLGGLSNIYASAYDGGSLVRPVGHGEIRRQSDSGANLSPASPNSAFGGFCTPPESQSTSDELSPISPFFSYDIHLSGQNPFVRSSSFSAIHQSQAYGSWQNLPYPLSRARAGSLASQSGSSMLYGGSASDYGARTSSQPISMELPRGYITGDGSMNRITDLLGQYLLNYIHASS